MLPHKAFFREHADGIHVIDTGFHRPQFDASYLVNEKGRAAFVDTGTNHSIPRLLASLEAVGLSPDQVDYVIATHVHLDHAGGAGLLMRLLPHAKLVVHPRGARHMIDPTELMAGARAVYGQEELTRSYGDVIGVDAQRMIVTHDGMTLDFAGRPLFFIDTPGHARHHHCIWDERSRGFFTGDTFGLSYRELDSERGACLFPTTTPVQFDPEALRNSVKRMLAFEPDWMYLTHFGPVDNVKALGEQFLDTLDAMVVLGRSVANSAHRHEALRAGLVEIYRERLRISGCTMSDAQAMDLLALDIELNAQGMGIWLDRSQPH
ncbi:MAG: MBL fold metallo-hydrolase [Burkholderiales bacterium]|nr:MBL fold metallo-hydrolase [Burkholderiales bacterium]